MEPAGIESPRERTAPSLPAAASPAIPAAEPIEAALDRVKSLARSVRDGCGHAVMLGCGEAYLSPFAIFLGAGSLLIGLLASLPLLVGALAQLGSIYLLDRAPRRKPLVAVPALLQALCWVPLFALPLLFRDAGPEVLLACALLYFALGSFAAPAWNSWMGELVDPETRGDYFGRRDRLRTLCQLIAVLAAGATLYAANGMGMVAVGFGCVYGAALLARLFSFWELSRMDEPPYAPPSRQDAFTFREFLRRMPRSNFGRFSVYVGCMQAATQISGPFFALYMLRDLRFSYLQFTAASTVYILAQALTFHNWGRLGDRFGHFNVLRVTGFLTPVIPLLWLFSARFEAILVFQVVSGFIWAGFNLSTANFIFDTVTPPKRARCVAYYNVLMNSGILIGALIGGCIAPHLPRTLELPGHEIRFVSHLQVLFLISAFARLAVSLGFLPLIREVRQVEKPGWKVVFQIVGLSPIRGFRFSVFNGVHRKELQEAGLNPRAATEPEPVARTRGPNPGTVTVLPKAAPREDGAETEGARAMPSETRSGDRGPRAVPAEARSKLAGPARQELRPPEDDAS